ncbi:hypothetical protein F2Q68_00044801 [Brassica cretica]|uniref:Uncharacterized protein n=1 Tax=Brassica cretica TaxID=69181 RepID=A0A8S9LSA0_BRACR|nr:hypothetical protein F2Q68_00044801 [Brassica cretica]
MGWVRFGWYGKRGFTFCGFRMVVTRDFELQYIETKEVMKIRGIDMDFGITTACFVKIHGISDVKEMEYCKGRGEENLLERGRNVKQVDLSRSVPYRSGLVFEWVTAGQARVGCGPQNG